MPSKRRQVDDDDVDLDGVPDVHELLADMQKQMSGEVSKGISDASSRLNGVVSNTLAKMDEANQRRFAAHDHELDDLRRRVCVLERGAGEQGETNRQLSSGLAAASLARPPPRPVGSSWDREVDPSLVAVRTTEPTSIAAVEKVVSELLAECSVKREEIEITGDAPSKVFGVRFLGQPGLGAKRAGKFLGLRFNKAGFREFKCEDPAGGSCRIFFDHDKNGRQTRKEFIGRKLGKIVQDSVAKGKKVRHNRDEGVLSLDFTPLVRVLVANGDEKMLAKEGEDYTIEWNTALAGEMGIDKEAVASQLDQCIGNPARFVSWG